MRGGIWVLNIFAAIWGEIALIHLGWPVMAVPIGISVALLVWASRIRLPSRSAKEGARVGRLIGVWTAVEGVAIFATFALCPRLGIPDAAVPVLAIVVGLHFLPLAVGMPSPIYYATGPAMIAVGGAALLLPAADRYVATGIPCAIILWVSSVGLVLRGTRRRLAVN
jgi:hypothetical protein